VKATLIPVAFLLTGAIPLVFSPRLGGPGGPSLIVGDGGVAAALAASLRAMAALSCLLFLGMTTPVPELIRLARSCRFPAALAETALLIYNMLSVLLVASREMLLAQGSRLGYATTRNAYRSQSMLWSSLFVKALSRARRLEVGLASRGFTGDLRVVSRTAPASAAGILAAAAPVALVVLLSLLLA
jgi:cobalt/nickel transport system permease protein